MALTLRRRADVQLGRPVLVDAQLRGLAAAEACRLHAARDAQAHGSPVSGGLWDLTHLLERHAQQTRIVAAVVDQAAAAGGITGRKRDLLRLAEVGPWHLCRRDVQRPRKLVHRPLHGVVAERTAAAPDESARDRVGEY